MQDSQTEDFEDVLRKHGYERSDFSVQDESDTVMTPGAFPVLQGKVTIIRQSNNISREYEASTWSASFESDLISGVFN
jgi:hypothetical protein